jgi:hypothetical protein
MCVAELQELFELFWMLEAVDVVAVLPRRDAVRLFTFFPHRESCHLAGKPVQVDQWPRVSFGCVKRTFVDEVNFVQWHCLVCLHGVRVCGWLWVCSVATAACN